MDIRAAQADRAEVLAAFLREHPVPLVTWRLSSLDGSIEGQLYRDDINDSLADLTTLADLLGTEVTEETSEESESWTQQAVHGHYQRTPITVYGHITVAPGD
ncbi:hypothetical protein GIY23_20545 [Allosaccharopolyspora coralli]|uniref:Uncharacterized protein n=1 Tax=Allosaccharopolyspora coralli TaxID=2665642 RepID=A0A5Q3QJF9_9PSEU|nr:hypothetical protein [Allosaccharopolyspora coralli]QGK71589.1 hypothetical protein GIY23_20545 [Allosaccharopolyspora coralli]